MFCRYLLRRHEPVAVGVLREQVDLLFALAEEDVSHNGNCTDGEWTSSAAAHTVNKAAVNSRTTVFFMRRSVDGGSPPSTTSRSAGPVDR